MIALIPLFQEEMKRKGFSSSYLRFYCDSSGFPQIITNEPETQREIQQYFEEQEINPCELTYEDVIEVSYDYVRMNVPPQLTDEEDGVQWYDETYDLWISNIAYYVTYFCFEVYMHDHKNWVDR